MVAKGFIPVRCACKIARIYLGWVSLVIVWFGGQGVNFWLLIAINNPGFIKNLSLPQARKRN